jgi:hypothetical protein
VGFYITGRDSITNKVRITAELRKFWEQPKRVFSLIGESYLLSKLNATCKFSIAPV